MSEAFRSKADGTVLQNLAEGEQSMVGSVLKSLQIPSSKSSDPRMDLLCDAVAEISGALRRMLSDVFSLYVKTKGFHWHVTGRHFRDHHLMLDEQADQILAMTDAIAERARKIGGPTVRSISDISRYQRLKDNNEEGLAPRQMFEDLRADNQQLSRFLRGMHEVCERHSDFATASLIEIWLDEAERRVWFLSEILSDV